MLLETEMEAFLHSGCALIVGLVRADGSPHATRGWGLTVLDGHTQGDGAARLRLLLDAGDTAALRQLATSCAIAITAADVRTLRSVQLKGRSLALEPVTDADRERYEDYADRFFADIEDSDRTPRRLLDRMRPIDVVPCIVEATELFDQTPGPSAGGRLDGGGA